MTIWHGLIFLDLEILRRLAPLQFLPQLPLALQLQSPLLTRLRQLHLAQIRVPQHHPIGDNGMSTEIDRTSRYMFLTYLFTVVAKGGQAPQLVSRLTLARLPTSGIPR